MLNTKVISIILNPHFFVTLDESQWNAESWMVLMQPEETAGTSASGRSTSQEVASPTAKATAMPFDSRVPAHVLSKQP